MGLLDRVKQNQTVPPGTVGTANGPAVGTVPPAASTYGPATSIPIAQTAPPAPAPAPRLSQRAGAAAASGGQGTPAFTAAEVQMHDRLVEKIADQTDARNKIRV